MDALLSNTTAINQLLARYGVKFGIYKEGSSMNSFSLSIHFLAS